MTSVSTNRTIKDLVPLESLNPVVLNLGMGVDSTAILLRYLFEPECRDFELSDLVVITAQTGDEWERTGADVEAHILPLLRAHGIRYVQVARNRPNVNKSNERDAIDVLDDSTSPTKVYLEGSYKLSQEMFDNGTLPQLGGARKCSMHAKGWALDPAVARLTAGRKFRQIIGFEANETSRVPKDAKANTHLRTGVYPLIEWGWDRAKCEAYIKERLGVDWAKSACKGCPFACSNNTSRKVVFKRYQDEDTEAAMVTLMQEHCSLAFNERQGVLGERHLVDLLGQAGYMGLVDQFQGRLAAHPTWALYEVRRIVYGPGSADRSLRRLAEGTQVEMDEALLAKAIETEAEPEVGSDGISRAWLRRREPERKSTVEHFYVVVPAIAKDKQKTNFPTNWARHTYRANMRARDRARRAAEATS